MESDSPRPSTEKEETLANSRLETRAAATQPYRPAIEQEFVEGQQLGSYRLNRMLGKGGFGHVWEAEDVDTGRKLAMKILTHVSFLSSNMVELAFQ